MKKSIIATYILIGLMNIVTLLYARHSLIQLRQSAIDDSLNAASGYVQTVANSINAGINKYGDHDISVAEVIGSSQRVEQIIENRLINLTPIFLSRDIVVVNSQLDILYPKNKGDGCDNPADSLLSVLDCQQLTNQTEFRKILETIASGTSGTASYSWDYQGTNNDRGYAIWTIVPRDNTTFEGTDEFWVVGITIPEHLLVNDYENVEPIILIILVLFVVEVLVVMTLSTYVSLRYNVTK